MAVLNSSSKKLFSTPNIPILKRLFKKKERLTKSDVFSYENVLGTSLDVQFFSNVKGTNFDDACEGMFTELERLEVIYNRFDSESELNYWLANPTHTPSDDLAWLIQKANFWIQTTNGAFHPAVDSFTKLWQQAELTGQTPNTKSLQTVLSNLTSSRELNFNAIAKGKIVDQAAKASLLVSGITGVTLNIGGDMRHIGSGSATVAIGDAFSIADNDSPSLKIQIQNQALATSGSSRRGFTISDKWYSHVIDPRTGYPVSHIQSVSVIAPDCATADVLATSFTVLEPQESIALANSLNNIGCHIVSKSKETTSNEFFNKHIPL